MHEPHSSGVRTISHFVRVEVVMFAVTDNVEFCIGTTLPSIGTSYILLPFGSILYHLGQLVYFQYSSFVLGTYINMVVISLKTNGYTLIATHILFLLFP